MKRALRVGALVVGSFIALALLLDGLAGLTQPSLSAGDTEGTLRITDDEGVTHETRLAVFEDADGVIWVQSGHHFRGWYERVKAHADVELVRGGVALPYRAVALETPQAKAHVRALIRDQVGVVGYYAIRTFLLFADIKPVRLDPRPP